MSDYKVKPLFSTQPAPVSQPAPVQDAGALAPAKKIRPLFASSTPAAIAPDGPVTASRLELPGMFVRKRLPVDRDSLRIEYQIEEHVLDQAIEIISRINVDQISAGSFTDFGLEPQQLVTEFSNEMFDLTTNAVIEVNLKQVKQLVDLISAEDTGFFSMPRLGQQSEAVRMEEIRKRSAFLRGQISAYPAIQEKVQSLEGKLQTALLSVTSWTVAGQYVTKYLKVQNNSIYVQLIDTVDRRVQSLMLTQIGLRQSQLQLKNFADNIRYQQISLLDALENMVPIWLTNISQKTSNPNLKNKLIQVLKGSYAKV